MQKSVGKDRSNSTAASVHGLLSDDSTSGRDTDTGIVTATTENGDGDSDSVQEIELAGGRRRAQASDNVNGVRGVDVDFKGTCYLIFFLSPHQCILCVATVLPQSENMIKYTN